MNKLLILCCINIINVIYAAPLKSDAKINEILQQLDIFKKCPAVLNNNIDVHKSNGGLSHCKNVSIGSTPEQIDLTNLNEFYCIGLLAADIQLCSGNRTNKIPKMYDDLKTNIDKIKNEQPEKICSELKQLKLFNEIESVTNLKKWVEVLDKNLHGSPCVGLCSDIEHGNTNVLCSMIYYINNNISYVTIAEKNFVPPPKVIQDTTIHPTYNDNAQQKVTTPGLKNVPLKTTNAVDRTKTLKPELPAASAISSANIKDNPAFETRVVTVKPPNPVVNAPSSENISPPVNNEPVNNQPVINQPVINQPVMAAVDKPQKDEEPVVEITTTKPIPPVHKDESVNNDAQVNTVQITEESKQPPPGVNPNPVVEETQKISSNVESSSVSSTISGVRDDFGDDYLEEVEEINKENEDQLIPQTNSHKETIEILPNDQDRHRIPTEDGDDMEDSNFFSYFMFVSVMFIAGYVVYHNKQKIMALLLEGRRDRNSRRRPNTASYRKLNSNLEEAVTSKCSGSASHVIY